MLVDQPLAKATAQSQCLLSLILLVKTRVESTLYCIWVGQLIPELVPRLLHTHSKVRCETWIQDPHKKLGKLVPSEGMGGRGHLQGCSIIFRQFSPALSVLARCTTPVERRFSRSFRRSRCCFPTSKHVKRQNIEKQVLG